MAEDKHYVEVGKFTVKDICDSKHTSRVVDLMTSIAEDSVKKAGGLTTSKPAGKDAKGWTVFGSLLSLGPDSSGAKFVADVSVIVATWPGKSLKENMKAKGSIPNKTKEGEDLPAKDVERLVKPAMVKAMADAVDLMEKETPE